MRDLEFLPTWYHQTRRRKRVVLVQSYTLIMLAAGLGLWLVLAQRNVRAAQTTLTTLKGMMDQEHTEQRLLAKQLSLRQQLKDREQLIASLGYPVEMTRLMQTLDTLMPKEMTITEFDCTTDQQAKSVPGSVKQTTPDRRLKVKMTGVSPSDVDLAKFLDGLTNVTFFEQVNVTYSRDRVDAGHVFREFEITFQMDLNQPL